MKVFNKKLTTNYDQLPEARVADIDFLADPDNTGVVTITLHDNPNAIVDKLGAGDSFNRATGFDLQELDVKSSVADDILIMRW